MSSWNWWLTRTIVIDDDPVTDGPTQWDPMTDSWLNDRTDPVTQARPGQMTRTHCGVNIGQEYWKTMIEVNELTQWPDEIMILKKTHWRRTKQWPRESGQWPMNGQWPIEWQADDPMTSWQWNIEGQYYWKWRMTEAEDGRTIMADSSEDGQTMTEENDQTQWPIMIIIEDWR